MVSSKRGLACVVLAGSVVLACSAAAQSQGGGRIHGVPLGTAPSVSKRFDPARIAPGGATLVTITLTNHTDTPATLTGELDDDLPSPIVIGGGTGTTTCPNGVVSAIGGFAIFALGLGAEIPANGSCTVGVCVTTDVAGMYTNTIPAGALQTDAGNNAGPASAVLTVTDDVIFADGFDGVPGDCGPTSAP